MAKKCDVDLYCLTDDELFVQLKKARPADEIVRDVKKYLRLPKRPKIIDSSMPIERFLVNNYIDLLETIRLFPPMHMGGDLCTPNFLEKLPNRVKRLGRIGLMPRYMLEYQLMEHEDFVYNTLSDMEENILSTFVADTPSISELKARVDEFNGAKEDFEFHLAMH